MHRVGGGGAGRSAWSAGRWCTAVVVAVRAPPPRRRCQDHPRPDRHVFDTHQSQLTRDANLLASLDEALDRFWARLEESKRADGTTAASSTVVMTTSEFGRRPAEAATGTDHGTAGTVLLSGPAVRGGRHDAPPDLGDLDRAGNLRPTTDFRSLYATMLRGWLGVDAEPVLGGTFEALPLLRG